MKKLFTLLLLLVATASSALATDEKPRELYLVGQFNNWKLMDESCKFTDNGDNTFTLEFKGTLDAIFKINDGTWGATYNIGCLWADRNVKLDTPVPLFIDKDSNNFVPTKAFENPVIKLDWSKKTLTISGKEGEIKSESGYAIHGTVFGGTGWWSTNLTKQEDGTYTHEAENWQEGDFGIKVFDLKSENQTDWFSADGDANITESVIQNALKCKKAGTNWHSTLKGAYKVTFDPVNMTLKFDKSTAVLDLAGESAPAVYYNMQGVRMPQGAVAPGIYVVKQGGKTSKVLVK